MKYEWQVSESDTKRLKAYAASAGALPFVRRRRARNVDHTESCDWSDEEVWRVLLGCLLTTQQRSGAGSPVASLLDERPFPLRLALVAKARDRADFIARSLSRAGGIRRAPPIGVQAATNLGWLEAGGWSHLAELFSALGAEPIQEAERRAAHVVQAAFVGIGPEQSRNVLQWLGLTRYEIPLDSRVTRWIRDFGFPIDVRASSLADLAFYEFVLDGVHALCASAGILPCELDAMIFASAEPEDWQGDSPAPSAA